MAEQLPHIEFAAEVVRLAMEAQDAHDGVSVPMNGIAIAAAALLVDMSIYTPGTVDEETLKEVTERFKVCVDSAVAFASAQVEGGALNAVA